MNIILNPGQTNTKLGDITLPAFVNLTGDENLLWKIVNNNGTANFTLPAAITDQAFYVGASGDIAGNNVAADNEVGAAGLRKLAGVSANTRLPWSVSASRRCLV